MAAPQGFISTTDLNDQWMQYENNGQQWAYNKVTGERKPVTFNTQGASWDDLMKFAASYADRDREGGGFLAGTGPNINGINSAISRNQNGNGVSSLSYSGGEGAPDGMSTKFVRGADGSVQREFYTPDDGIPLEMLAVLAAPFAVAGLQGAGFLGGATSAATAETLSALPAGGMTSTGITAPWAQTAANTLGSGTFGTGVADIGALMGTGGGAFPLGSGLAGVTAADIAAATSFLPGALPATPSAPSAPSPSTPPPATPPSPSSMLPVSLTDILSNPLTKVGASILSGVMGDKAADKAADAQTAAANAAIGEQRRQYDQTRTDLAPWRDRGGLAANRLAVMMGLNGNAQDPAYNTGYQAVPTYSAPNRNAFAQYVPFK